MTDEDISHNELSSGKAVLEDVLIKRAEALDILDND